MVIKKVKMIDVRVLGEREMKRIAGGISQGEL
jgi:hypothetical protein